MKKKNSKEEKLQQELKEEIDKYNKVIESDEVVNVKKKIKDNSFFLTIIIILLLFLIFLLLASINDKSDKILISNRNIKTYKDVAIEKQNDVIGKTSNNKKDENITDNYKTYEKLTEDEKQSQEVIPRKEEVPFETIDEIKDIVDYDEKSKLPKKFNLNNVINLQVEDQKDFGLCWDFSSMKSLESNIALKHNKNEDLSEIHLDYIESNLFYGMRSVHEGGNFSDFEKYFSDSGAVLESDAEYRDYSSEEYSDFPNKNIVVKATETVNFPSLYSISEKQDDYEEQKNEYINIIKSHIMNNGSIYAVILAPDSDREYFYPETSSMYFNGDKNLINYDRWLHAVSIVGWDDNYSKDNFNIKPEKDGAFIALNSWGNFWGENGYFYISYEDQQVYNDLNGVISTSYDKTGYIKISDVKNPYIYDLIKEYIEIIDGQEYVSKLSLNNVRDTDLSNKNITNSDLEIIKYFGTYILNLSNNPKLTDITSLKNRRLVELNLSDNVNIKDYDNINTFKLILKNNNIKKLSEKVQATELDLSGNKELDLNTLPLNVEVLVLQDCDIKDLSKIPKLNKLFKVDLSNNKIEKIDGIEQISKEMMEINLSNNNISSLKPLEKLLVKDNYLYLNLSYNKIEDIEEINNLNITDIDLSYNKITDLSNYNNDHILFINLSHNKNIKNINKLSYVDFLNLSDCDLTEISFYDDSKISTLDISYNNISNYDFVKKMSNLYNLSLKGNNINNRVESETLSSLNVEECNLESIDISALPNLFTLNYSNNKSIDNLFEIINNLDDGYGEIFLENMSLDTTVIDNIYPKLIEKNIYLDKLTVISNVELLDNKIEFDSNSALYSVIQKNKDNLLISNGILNEDGTITVIDLSIGKIEITSSYYDSYFSGLDVIIPKKIIINY